MMASLLQQSFPVLNSYNVRNYTIRNIIRSNIIALLGTDFQHLNFLAMLDACLLTLSA